MVRLGYASSNLFTIFEQEIILESLLTSIEAFILGLPPLLQMLLGIFGMIGMIKLFMFTVDLIEDRREGKK